MIFNIGNIKTSEIFVWIDKYSIIHLGEDSYFALFFIKVHDKHSNMR